jgi:hypothetical protein
MKMEQNSQLKILWYWKLKVAVISGSAQLWTFSSEWDRVMGP